MMFKRDSIRKVETEKAPKALGPYSQAIMVDNLVFISGQIGIDPAIGKILEQSIEGQTRRVLKNIEAILAAVSPGLTFEQVVKCEIFMQDLKDFQAMNSIYEEFFSHPIQPARQTIQVAKLPSDALIEISCIAVKPPL